MADQATPEVWRKVFEQLGAKAGEEVTPKSVKRLRAAVTSELFYICLKAGILSPDEKPWAERAAAVDLAALVALVIYRGESAALINETLARRIAAIDQTQAEMNRKLGVSPELFLKHNQR